MNYTFDLHSFPVHFLFQFYPVATTASCFHKTSTVNDSQHSVATTASCFDNTSTVRDSHHPVATTASCIDNTSTISYSHHPIATTTSCFDNMSTISDSHHRILSTVATSFTNKELQGNVNCTDYEYTQARRQATEYGLGVTPQKTKKFITKFRIALEDLEFVLNFIHNPDNTDPSSNMIASCDGKK